MVRKGKANPASSAKALQVCGDTSKLSVSAADIFAQFDPGYTAAPAAGYAVAGGAAPAASVGDVDVSLAMQAIQKKDPTTRLRGVAELQQLFSNRPADVLKETCGPFMNIYRHTWPLDAEPRVREGLSRCLQVLAETLQRDFQKHLRAAFPTWLLSMRDTHPDVVQTARKAFVTVFPTDEKRRGVFRHCQAECLSLLFANLRHSEQSLHDELGVKGADAMDKNTALERQDRYARVISASLSGLGELVHVCSAAASLPTGKAAELLTYVDLERAFAQGSPCHLWSRLSSKQPVLVRRAAAECLVRILQSPSREASMAPAAVRSSAINAMADEAVPAMLSATLLCSFGEVGGADCWVGLNAAKSLWPQVLALTRRVAAQDSAFLKKLPTLLQAFPQSGWDPGRAEALLQALLEALEKSRAPADELWRAYLATLRIAAAAGAPAVPSFRFAPVVFYLRSTPSASDAGTASADAPVPSCKAPALAYAAVLGALLDEMPKMLAGCWDGQELVRALDAHAPVAEVLETVEALGTASGRGGRGPWDRWLAIVSLLLSTGAPQGEELAQAARDLIAKHFRRLLVLILRRGATEQLEGWRAIIDAIGKFMVLAEPQAEPAWLSLETSDLANAVVEAPAPAPEGWATEAAMLSWPLLPLWRAWFQADPGGEAAQLLGYRVIRPLLKAAMSRHRNAFPSSEIRDLAINALVGCVAADGAPLNEPGTPVQGLGFAVRLALECLPADLGAGASPLMQKAVTRLGLHLIQDTAASDSEADTAALVLALKPGGMPLPRTQEALQALVSAMEELRAGGGSECEARRLRLAVVVGTALTAHLSHRASTAGSSESEGSPSLLDMRFPTASVLLAALARREDAEPAAWSVLPGLLDGPGALETACASLGSLPPEGAHQRRWLRALRAAAAAAHVSAATLLCACRGGVDGLRLRGVATVAELQERAAASATVLEVQGGAVSHTELEPHRRDAVGLLAWEVLMSTVAGGREASAVWAWFDAETHEERAAFVRTCAAEAAEEGRRWQLVAEASAEGVVEAKAVGPAGLHGIGVFREVLLTAWPDGDTAAAMDCDGLLRWALDLDPTEHAQSPAWGHVVAAIVSRYAATHGVVASSALAAQGQWRRKLQDAAAAQALSAPLLIAAAEVEHWSLGAGCAAGRSELAAGEDAQAKALGDVAERLLRWAQSTNRLADRDALAIFMAAIWPDLEPVASGASGSGPSKHASRMQRHAVELLVDSAKDADVLASPGALRLVVAVSEKHTWPESLWPHVVQALSDADTMAAEAIAASREFPRIAMAFLQDTMAAAEAVLHFVPEAHVVNVLPLLQASHAGLQNAAVARFRRRAWVPQRRSEIAEASQDVVERLDAVLQEAGPAGEEPSRSQAQGDASATRSDIASAALVYLAGHELASQAWALEDALAALLSWITGDEGEDSDTDDADDAAAGDPEHDADQRSESEAAVAGNEEDTPMPFDCRRRCVAVLAAWELLLLGVQAPPSAAGGAASGEMEPPELLVAALQASPDQAEADEWTSPLLPLSDGHSPIKPLLQVLLLVLTCGRCASGTGSAEAFEEGAAQLTAAVSAATAPGGAPECSPFALSARVLFLLLRTMPVAVRSFWEQLPRRRDRDHLEQLVARSLSPALMQAEAQAASALLEAQVGSSSLPDTEATVVRRNRQVVLHLEREELRGEICVVFPESFPLRAATAEQPEKMPGISRASLRNWMLQGRQVLCGPKPMGVGRVMLMWARSFALFFKGVEDCPICYNVVHLTTQKIPQKTCPTCKHKFHNDCLYHWFKTSDKTTCPLCSQPF